MSVSIIMIVRYCTEILLWYCAFTYTYMYADQDLFAVLDECFNFINDFRSTTATTERKEKPSRILIHCYQGVSRAASVSVAYMVKYFGYSVDHALAIVRQCRPQASPNYNFMKSLRVLESQSLKLQDGNAELKTNHVL